MSTKGRKRLYRSITSGHPGPKPLPMPWVDLDAAYVIDFQGIISYISRTADQIALYPGSADGFVRVILNGGDKDPGLLLRYIDSDHCIFLHDNGVRLFLSENDTPITSVQHTYMPEVLLEIRLTGHRMQVALDGLQVFDGNVSNITGNEYALIGSAGCKWIGFQFIQSVATYSGGPYSTDFHYPDGPLPAPWLAAASWVIDGNTAYHNDTDDAYALIPSGLANCTIHATLGDPHYRPGVSFRMSSDLQDGWVVVNFDNETYLFQRQGGTYVTIDSTGGAATGDDISVLLQSNGFTVSRNGNILFQRAETFQADSGNHGPRSSFLGSRVTYFSIA